MAAALPAIYLCNMTDTPSTTVDVGIEKDAVTKRYEKWVYTQAPSLEGFHKSTYKDHCICYLARDLGILKEPLIKKL